MKVKPIMPTLRERKRYMAYEFISREPLKKDVSKSVVDKIRKTLGLFDSAEAGVMSIEYDQEKQKGILKVSHTSVDKARVALAMTRETDRVQVLPRVLGISGTLKNARAKYMN